MRERQLDHGTALVRVRIDGPADAVARCAERVRQALDVVRESRDYGNRPPSTDVRRYLDVLVDGEQPAAEVERRG
jgi:hypothetical protein